MSETRKLAAILVADVVGYSRLAGSDEDRTLARLRGLRSDLIDPAIAAHRGRIVKRTGDGSIIEFRSVVDAVRCAIEIQNGLIERNAGVPEDRRIEFRVGIHVGDVVEESDGDLMGDGVNIAARLEGIAKPGAICLSEDAYRQVSGRLEMEVTDLGPTQFKNIDRLIRAYSLQVGVPAKPKPARGATSLESKKRSRLALRGAAIAFVLFLAATATWYFLAVNRFPLVAANMPPPLSAARLSMVVLPFANLSGDPAQDSFADAVTDELTSGIARFPNSFVIAHNTALSYRGKPVDAKAIGKDLGVRYVLEGSIQPSANQVRVNVQLIDANTGAHLWADKFDTARADRLQMQDEIVGRLARELGLQLVEVEAARLKRTPAANPDAEDLAIQCMGNLQKTGYVGKEADGGYRLCEQALALDPNNTDARNQLSVKFYMPVLMGVSADPKSDVERAEELASKALALDPNNAFGHLSMAGIRRGQQRADDAIAEYERALALDPAAASALVGLGFTYMSLGRFDQSLESFDKAIRLSPHDPELSYIYSGKAIDYDRQGQYGQAIESAHRAIAIDPKNTSAYDNLSHTYLNSGQCEKSLEYFDNLVRHDPQDADYYSAKAQAHFCLKQYDHAIEAARQGIAINPNSWIHAILASALALTGHEAEAHDTLQRYLALPEAGRTIAAQKSIKAKDTSAHTDPRYLDAWERHIEGLRKAGLPEE
jgi:adenylate cyclase